MTEKEAIEWLAEETSPTLIHIAEMNGENPMEYINEAVKVACHALEEIQQYRTIGIIEEFKDLKEKATPKKPKESNFQNNMFPQCPICDEVLRINQLFCDGCGQKLDWEGDE